MLRSIVVLLIAISLSCCERPYPNYRPFKRPYFPTSQPTTKHAPHSENSHIIVWSDAVDYNRGPLQWYNLAKTKYKDPVIFLCHGVNFHNRWYLKPDPPRMIQSVEEVAITLHNLFPDSDIFLIVCNDGNLPLSVPRVWHSPKQVWCVPDYAIQFMVPERKEHQNDGVGDLEGFIPPPPEPKR